MKIVKAIYADRTIMDSVVGNTSPIYWKEVKNLQNTSNDKIQTVFGITNFAEYALKAFFSFSSAIDEGKFCVHYRPKADQEQLQKKRKYHNIIEKGVPYKGPPGDSTLYRTCGIITGVQNGSIYIKDRSDTVSIFYCDKCTKTYWGKYRKEKGLDGEKLFLGEGQPCDKTMGCDGKLRSGQTYMPKNLLIGNIEEITTKENININFQPYLKKAADYLKTNGLDSIEQKVQDVSTRHKDQVIKNRKELSVPEEEIQPVEASLKMISLSQFKKDDKSLKKLKKVWNANNEAVYDYWATLYGNGINGEDTEVRQDFADAMVENN